MFWNPAFMMVATEMLHAMQTPEYRASKDEALVWRRVARLLRDQSDEMGGEMLLAIKHIVCCELKPGAVVAG